MEKVVLVLLAGYQDSAGVLRFLGGYDGWAGLPIAIPSTDDLPAFVERSFKAALGDNSLSLELLHRSESDLIGPEGERGILILGRVDGYINSGKWHTFAEILRGESIGKNRVTLMKVLQYLSGGQNQDVEAREVSWQDLIELSTHGDDLEN